jgi:hypothetical protein
MAGIDADVTEQIIGAYRQMAAIGYRPSALGDGYGHIDLPAPTDLEPEARRYADAWWESENRRDFFIGTCHYPTRSAAIFAIEAVRQMGSEEGIPWAIKLLQMAERELAALPV